MEVMLQAERALTMGLVDQAERLYRQALDRDPQNAIALVGLARVAVERNDERGAHSLAEQALRVDPQNAAALRIEARLAEVLAARGEPVERAPHAVKAVQEANRRTEKELDGVLGRAATPSPARPDGPPATGTASRRVAESESRIATPAREPAAMPTRTQTEPTRDAGEAAPRKSSGLLRRLLGR